jgi:N-acetylglucosamine kinase-like BadF-type ATPase
VTDPGTILAADGGNSKIDLLLASAEGRILGFRTGGTVSHQQVGLAAGIERLAEMARGLAGTAGVTGPGPLAEVGAFCLAGADFPAEVRLLTSAIEATGLVRRTIVRNDTLAALRAGTTRRWGVALICGQGVNAVAVGRSGQTAGFDAVGEISGDWGGGSSLGEAALGAAVRATDGRGASTSLARLVPAHFGRKTPGALVRDLYYGRLAQSRLSELSPLVFEAAIDRDAVARSIVDRLADELAVMVAALVRRTQLARQAPEVVLAGGVFRNRDDAFYARLDRSVQASAPGARLVRLAVRPVIGAALIGLDALDLPPDEAASAESGLRAAGALLQAVGDPA